MNMDMYSRVAAELESARAEIASLGNVSASRAERAFSRLQAAEEAWEQLRAA